MAMLPGARTPTCSSIPCPCHPPAPGSRLQVTDSPLSHPTAPASLLAPLWHPQSQLVLARRRGGEPGQGEALLE